MLLGLDYESEVGYQCIKNAFVVLCFAFLGGSGIFFFLLDLLL